MSEELNENTDYYVLLGCDPDCSPDDLKKAYRKAAMKWHPDRNHGNVEEATRVFQLIEHAYSILSDDHERAWYDGHRNLTTDDEGQIQASKVDIMSLFHACAYIGFSEKSNGFYPVFRNAFATIAEEENAEAPGFGNAESSWEDVNAFYAYWTCFKTKRSFAYADLYRLKDAPNAMYRRAMKQDNEKARQKAEREFVNQVRELASYVKKRDPRVINHLKDIEEQRALREAEEQAKRDAERKKLLDELDKLEKDQQQIEYTEDDLIYIHQFDNNEEKEQKAIEKWSCPFCKKEIRSMQAFRAHCKTKVHQKKITGPKKRFLNDLSLYPHTAKTYVLLCMNMDEIRQIEGDEGAEQIDLEHLDDEEEECDDENQNEEDEEEQEQEQKNRPLSKKDRRKMKKDDDDDKTSQNETKKGGPNNNSNNKKLSKKELRRLQILEEKAKKQQQIEDEQKAKNELKKAKNDQRKKKEIENANEANDNDDQDEAPQNANPQKNLSKKELRKMRQQQQQQQQQADDNDDDNDNEQEVGGQKNQQQNNNQPKRLPKNIKNPPPGMEMCRKCRLLFPSRRKLFDHLKESGHATAV